MEIVYLVLAMIGVGAAIGALGGAIWKGNRPYGLGGDLAAGILTAVVVGLLDFYVIPQLGFSEQMKWLGVALEPPLGALVVLWAMRRIKK